MSNQTIDDFIQMAEQREADAHGSNKQCFFIDNYALLNYTFTTEELDKIMQISEELEKKGVNVVKTLDYKVIDHVRQAKDGNYVRGYVLQERAIGKPLFDETNYKKDSGQFQIDYFKQIDSIAQEGQQFFDNFVRGWIEIQKAGIMIDPSKPSNFIYNPGHDLTLIDLGIAKSQMDMSDLTHEQLAVILNSKTFNRCYPEIRQAVSKRFDIIIGKYKAALKEQGIVLDDYSIEDERNKLLKENENQTEIIGETPEQELKRLEQSVAEHIKEEEKKREEARRLREEREEKARIEREKKEAENRRLEEEEERQNGGKRKDSKMYAILYGMLEQGLMPQEQAEIFKRVFQTKRNIYADLNPQLFKKLGTTVDLQSVIPNLKDCNIKIDMRSMQLTGNGDSINQNYEQIKIVVEDYFKQYFESISQNVEPKMLEYSKLSEMHKNGQLTEEQFIDFRLLEAELNEFSNANQLFSVLGINEQIMENPDRVSSFLQGINKLTDEEKAEIESKRRENDRDYLSAVFEDTGVTDPEELRRLYYSQDEIRVDEDDLEAVLSNFTSADNISPSQIGVATAKKGTGISDINQVTQVMRKSLEQDKGNELNK